MESYIILYRERKKDGISALQLQRVSVPSVIEIIAGDQVKSVLLQGSLFRIFPYHSHG